ncbi:AP2/ERF domain-containing protein, partial [Haematococcus lacustris]
SAEGGTVNECTGASTKRFRGVCTLKTGRSRYRAQICHSSRTWALGDYCTAEEAAAVYDRAAICKLGLLKAVRNSSLNFPAHHYLQQAAFLEAAV